MKTPDFKKYPLTWVPDLPDHRDHYFKIKSGASLPAHSANRSYTSSIQDQMASSSCTGQAWASAIETADRRKRQVEASRLYIYFWERFYNNEVNKDEGAYIRDGAKALSEYGWALESAWPFNLKRITKRPSPSVVTAARKHVVKEYQRVDNTNIEALKQVMTSGRTIVFGTSLYSNFYDIGSNGIVPMPRGALEGGHALHLVDFDDATNLCAVQNSWGDEWGDHGWCYFPYEYLTNGDLCDDFWSIRL